MQTSFSLWLAKRTLQTLILTSVLLYSSACSSGGGGHGTSSSVVVNVNPVHADVSVGNTQAFSVNVAGTSNIGVVWDIPEGSAGGSITAGGLYTPPNSAGAYHVRATSIADSSASGMATVTVHLGVFISPTSSTLRVRQTATFTATILGSTNTAVRWDVVEGNAGGTVTAAGLYTAPNTGGTYHVRATSVADATQTAVASVTVQAGSVSVTVD